MLSCAGWLSWCLDPCYSWVKTPQPSSVSSIFASWSQTPVCQDALWQVKALKLWLLTNVSLSRPRGLTVATPNHLTQFSVAIGTIIHATAPYNCCITSLSASVSAFLEPPLLVNGPCSLSLSLPQHPLRNLSVALYQVHRLHSVWAASCMTKTHILMVTTTHV